jgi:hypothetical protein
VQSVPRLQFEDSAPAPPSSHEPSEAELHVSVQVCAPDGGGGDGDGGGGEGRGEGGGGEGRGEGGGGGEATAQIVKPVLVTELSLDQVTVVPATTCTFIGPVEPEYAAFPILMKS